MFIGHFAVGYAAKRWAEYVRIAPGIAASTPLEFISYPYSRTNVDPARD